MCATWDKLQGPESEEDSKNEEATEIFMARAENINEGRQR